MKPETYNLFVVEGGPVAEGIAKFNAERRDAEKEQRAFMESIGATATFGNSRRVKAVRFSSTPDSKVWRSDGDGTYVPNLRSKAGKAMAAKMSTLGMPGIERFQECTVENGWFARFLDSKNNVRFVEMTKVGKVTFFAVPKESQEPWSPPDGLRPANWSEYFAAVEAEGGAQ